MNKKQKIKLTVAIIVLLGVITAAVLFFKSVNVDVLNPKGIVADQQKTLFLFTIILSLFVVIPVFILLGTFAWKYRDTNPKETDYAPDWDSSRLFEALWWGIPCVIILGLSVITWQTSHQLDPSKPIKSNVKPVEVQVVALQWKWLFIYPEQHVASVNLLEIPAKTPINFELTSDAPMNAFWIPSLGSQVYAMSGMSMQLHLMADKPGDYKGSSTNISGKDFASMTFTARAVSSDKFAAWVSRAQGAPSLSKDSYKPLAKPGTVKQPVTYSLADQDLYDSIVMKYMAPPAKDNKTKADNSDSPSMPGMDMEGME